MDVTIQAFYPGDEVTLNGHHFYVFRYYTIDGQLDLSSGTYGAGSQLFNVLPEKVRLVQRGNVFRQQFHMDLHRFADYGEEVRFWDILGKVRQVCNSRNKMFIWDSWNEVIADLEAGDIDVFMGSTGLAGMPMEYVSYSGHTIDADPSVKSRLRSQCLAELRSLQPA